MNSRPIGAGGHQVFFGDQLDAVGQRLQPAELAADAGRTEAILNAARDLAFQPDEEQRADRHDVESSSAQWTRPASRYAAQRGIAKRTQPRVCCSSTSPNRASCPAEAVSDSARLLRPWNMAHAAGIPQVPDALFFGDEYGTEPTGLRRPLTCRLTIDFSHHDIERTDDRGNVGDQAAAAKFMRYTEIREAAAPGTNAPRDGTAVAHEVEAHLAARGFRLQIHLALGQLFGQLDRNASSRPSAVL